MLYHKTIIYSLSFLILCYKLNTKAKAQKHKSTKHKSRFTTIGRMFGIRKMVFISIQVVIPSIQCSSDMKYTEFKTEDKAFHYMVTTLNRTQTFYQLMHLRAEEDPAITGFSS